MKIEKIYSVIFTATLFLLTSCAKNHSETKQTDSTAIAQSENRSVVQNRSSVSNPDKIDLTKIEYISPKNRVQDSTLKNQNSASITDRLIADGKDSIPFLINNLTDEKKINSDIIDYWSEIYAGDLALIILTDLFTKSDAQTSTINNFGWDEFLERGENKDLTGEQVLRRYIKKYGREKIKQRWQNMWEEHKDKIFWDETEKCFKLR